MTRQKQERYLSSICAILLSLVVLVSIWNMQLVYIPVLLLTGVAGWAMRCSPQKNVPLSVMTLSLFLLLLYEVISYFISDYKPNSLIFLQALFIIVCCVFIFESLIRNEKYKSYFVIFLSLLVGLLTLINLPVFLLRSFLSVTNEFSDFSQIRASYAPFGILPNLWVTILLCFLPFPLVGLLLFWKKKVRRYGLLFISGILIINILISFSRGAILAFFLFLFLLSILLFVNRLLSIKKLLLANLLVALICILCALCFFESFQSTIRQTPSHQRSTEARLKLWEQVVDVADKAPYFGVGTSNYAILGRPIQSGNLEQPMTTRTQNSFVQLLIEKGWIGFSLWACVMGFFFYSSVLQIRKGKSNPEKIIGCIMLAGVCAILFRELFFSSLLNHSGVLLLFFLLLVFGQASTDKTTILLPKPIATGIIAILISATICSHFLKPENALSYASKGLEYGRSMDKDSVSLAIQHYRNACRLSPYDAMFHHNLGSLYLMNQQRDSALVYFSQALKLDPNTAIYHISKGLALESQQQEEAFKSYKQAILLSPDIIDAPFFAALRMRDSIKAQLLVENAADTLSQLLSEQYSPIIEAKYGKILLVLGQTESAYASLSHAVQILPNLSRPWYYLGDIEYRKGNFEAMLAYYNKAIFLSPYDHLPLYALAHYYKGMGEQAKSESYFRTAESAWRNRNSVHSMLSKNIYASAAEKNDILPKGLFDDITPVFQASTLPQIQESADSLLIKSHLFLKNNMSAVGFRTLQSNSSAYSYTDNLAFAVAQYKKDSTGISFEDFCEYILPPFIYDEKIEDWRTLCYTLFEPITSGADIAQICDTLNVILGEGFTFGTNVGRRHTNWSSFHKNKRGDCVVMSQIVLYPLRALGYAATVDYTVAWGNKNGGHSWNAILIDGVWKPFMGLERGLDYLPFDVQTDSPETRNHGRYPPKVFRRTFSQNQEYLNISKQVKKSKQSQALFSDFRFTDVSAEYFSTVPVSIQSHDETAKVLFLNVYNSHTWKPVAAAMSSDDFVFSFKDMKPDMLYMASDPNNEDINFVPFALRRNGELSYFQAITNEFVSLDIEFLTVAGTNGAHPENDVDYHLYYYDSGWKKIATAKAQNAILHFDQIPRNALLILKDKNRKFIGRPFSLENGERYFW